MAVITVDWTNSPDLDECIKYAIQDILNDWGSWGYNDFDELRADVLDTVRDRLQTVEGELDDLYEAQLKLEEQKTALEYIDNYDVDSWIAEYHDGDDALPPLP